jgi:hypothetical protein
MSAVKRLAKAILISDIDGPIAVPLPSPDIDFGMPDAGFADMGGFDF